MYVHVQIYCFLITKDEIAHRLLFKCKVKTDETVTSLVRLYIQYQYVSKCWTGLIYVIGVSLTGFGYHFLGRERQAENTYLHICMYVCMYVCMCEASF
jgi:hypothetical protein